MVTWDERKRLRNLAKHGMDLADAVHFDFDKAVIEEDWATRDEQRFRALGWIEGQLCFLVFALIDDEVRAISLRRADKSEKRKYVKALSSLDRR